MSITKVVWQTNSANMVVDTNVPHLVTHHASDGNFAVGYSGSGPADFALNILEWVLRERGYKGTKVDCFKGQCFRKAWELHQQFKEEFLVNAPDKGELTFFEVVSFIYGSTTPNENL